MSPEQSIKLNPIDNLKIRLGIFSVPIEVNGYKISFFYREENREFPWGAATMYEVDKKELNRYAFGASPQEALAKLMKYP